MALFLWNLFFPASHYQLVQAHPYFFTAKATTMQPEMILQADVLDIIFDNRNKEYGAYELRCHYERRLKKSLWIMFLFLA
ncbi:MAG: hypothetical protein JST13_08905, partial [Bacteroidetes bacterium]|nr:hypothetical protein [Bacteroidota bacterium]